MGRSACVSHAPDTRWLVIELAAGGLCGTASSRAGRRSAAASCPPHLHQSTQELDCGYASTTRRHSEERFCIAQFGCDPICSPRRGRRGSFDRSLCCALCVWRCWGWEECLVSEHGRNGVRRRGKVGRRALRTSAIAQKHRVLPWATRARSRRHIARVLSLKLVYVRRL